MQRFWPASIVPVAYPCALFHRQFLYKKVPILQHAYFIAVGSYMGYFNYGRSFVGIIRKLVLIAIIWIFASGWEVIHAYICIVVQYALIVLLRANLASVVFSFTFQMTYLIGYYCVTESAIYDIKWTIPHCVLTLRLIGQAFDIHDGTKDAVSTLSSFCFQHKRVSRRNANWRMNFIL